MQAAQVGQSTCPFSPDACPLLEDSFSQEIIVLVNSQMVKLVLPLKTTKLY